MDKTLAQDVNKFHQTIASTGEDIVFRLFPTKLLELQDVIDTTRSETSPFHSSHRSHMTDTVVQAASSVKVESEDAGTKKRKLSNGSEASGTSISSGSGCMYPHRVAANLHTRSLHDTLTNEVDTFIGHVDTVKLWVTLTMPKIEDGDNFGVQIQEEVLGELQRAQEASYQLRDAARQDHLARAKICSKLIKYPNVEDYTLALKEHDQKQLFFARQHIIDLRNMYAALADVIHKNISKIRSPKSNNSSGLY